MAVMVVVVVVKDRYFHIVNPLLDTDAKLGIIAAGSLKLLIPFFAIAPGVAAYYLFQQKMPDRTVSPDAVFPELVKLVIPVGYGLIGIIGAGLIGAILSSIDSMMNLKYNMLILLLE